MSAEKALIARIRRMAGGRRNPSIRTGIGDDCAVLRLQPGRGKERDHEVLITTDLSLENIHFRRNWHPPESVGHRCLARGLSDIAAMGGTPVAAFLSLALPRNLQRNWVERFMKGLISLGENHGVTLAGGDMAESPDGILADIIVVGSAPKGQALLRSSARAGDLIYVSGVLGGSAAAISALQKAPRLKLGIKNYTQHFFPEPRIELGRILRERGLASAMIDTSDGLSTDLTHLCEESGVGAELQAEAIPKANVGNPARRVGLELALHGGEDYELLFTAPHRKRVPPILCGVPLTQIGQITRNRKILLLEENKRPRKLQPQGWEHFGRAGYLGHG
jgi:thiamine-monophosphate kinase